MDIDPHTLQQIVQKITQQMRCPQCGKRIPVDFSSVRVTGDDFLLLQLKCETCQAYIVLHAALQGVEHLGVKEPTENQFLNVSSKCYVAESEKEAMEKAIADAGGSFEVMFKS